MKISEIIDGWLPTLVTIATVLAGFISIGKKVFKINKIDILIKKVERLESKVSRLQETNEQLEKRLHIEQRRSKGIKDENV